MIAGECRVGGTRWRKVRTPYGSMPRKIRGQHSSREGGTGVDGKCHRKHTAGSLRKAQARVKRRGKSSPLAKRFARHEKPHAVQDKTEEGQPARFNPRVSSHHGECSGGLWPPNRGCRAIHESGSR